jgi:serine/threonine-protein kinase
MNERDRAIPERLGRYDIVERLAAGGMGEVFVARFVAPGGFVKPVAVKRIHPHLSEDEQFINMLHDEANVAAAVKHPNIVATIDVGCEGSDHFVVLDFVSGDPMSKLLRELKKRALVTPAWVVAWVGAQVASALHAAHEARNLQGERLDIVHRDVSPQNIMLSDAGHPMLFDFGVAKAKQRIVHTTHGELKGKLAYMAPETFRGAPIDRSVDIFALGVVLYELLTNVSPFQRASDLDTITALQSAVVPPPSRLQPGDAHLDAIVLAAMARSRAERYPTAAHLERALRDWARAFGLPHEAGPVANWIATTFPERLAARRELLARVANLQRSAHLDRPSHLGMGGLTPAVRAGTPVQTGASGFVQGGAQGSGVGPPPGATDPRLSVGPTTGSQLTMGGVSRLTGATPPLSRGRAIGVALGGILVGGVIAYALAARVAGSSKAAAEGVPTLTATAPPAAAPPAATPAAAAASSVAAAPPTTTAVAAAAPPNRPAVAHPGKAQPPPAAQPQAPPQPQAVQPPAPPPPQPPPADASKSHPSKGPILRDYE